MKKILTLIAFILLPSVASAATFFPPYNASGAYNGNVGIGSTTPHSLLSIGTGTASTTITMGRIQWQGSNSAGATICAYFVGTTMTAQLGACN